MNIADIAPRNEPGDWSERQRLNHIYDAMEDVIYLYEQYTSARDLASQAGYLVELNNRMHDLSTWHPRFDQDRGEMIWDGEDDE